MALTIGQLVGYLRVDDSQWSQRLDKAEGQFRAVGGKVTSAGKQLTTKVTLPLAGAGLAILRSAGNFEASMNRVRAATGVTGAELDAMETLARDLGASTVFSAGEAADAMYFLSSAGFDVSEVMSTLPGVLDLAAAGNMDLASAADIASNVLSGYGLEADQLGRVNDALVKTFQRSNVNVQMVGDSMKMVAPIAAAAGLSFEETTAAIGLLGNAGIQGSEAGTALRGALGRLLKPTTEVADTLDALGVNATDSQGNLRDLSAILGDLEAAGATTTDMMALFGQEAGPAMQALLSQGSGALSDLTGQLENSAGAASEAAAVQMEGLNGQLAGLRSAAEALAQAVADTGLLEWATSATKRFTDWLRTLSKTNPQLLKVVTIAAAIVAALGPVLLVVGKLISLLGGLVGNVARAVKNIIKIGKTTGQAVMALGRMGAAAARAGGRFLVAAAQATAAAARIAASMAATAARVVAGWALMAVQSLIRAAQMAAAWLISMGPVGIIIAIVAALVALIIANWDTVKEWTVKIFTAVWDFVKRIAKFLFDVWMKYSPVGIIISNWEKIKKAFRAGIDWVRDKVRAGLRFIVDLFKKITPLGIVISNWDKIKGLFRAGLDWLRDKVRAGLDRLLGFFRDLPGKIGRGLSTLRGKLLAPFKAAFNAIAGLWNRSLGSISFTVPGWVPGVGGKGWSFPKLPQLAMGGRIMRAGVVEVGERGRELLHLPEGAMVEPLGRARAGDRQLGDTVRRAVADGLGRARDWPLYVENLNMRAVGGEFRPRQVQRSLALHAAR